LNSPHNRLKGIPSSHLQPSYPTHLFSLKQSQCCFLSLKSKDDKVRNCKLTKQHDTLFYIAATPRLGALNRKRQRFHPLEKGNIALYPIVFGFAKRLGMARPGPLTSHQKKKIGIESNDECMLGKSGTNGILRDQKAVLISGRKFAFCAIIIVA